MSIDKRILSKAVMALNKEHYKGRWPELLNKTFNQITFNCPQLKAARRSPESTWQKNIAPEKSLYSQDKWHGLAIGNLPSQWSACVIVMLALRIIQKYEVVDSIIDYMDDMIWLVKDKEKFLRTLPAIEKELKETLNITLHPRKRNLQHYTKGWKMVGGKGKNCRLYASDRTIHRAEAKLKYLRSVHDVEGTFRSVNSYFGILSKFSTYKFRKEEADKILKEFGREIYFNGQLTKCVLKKKYNTREQVKSTILRGRARTQTLNNLYENAA